MAQITLYLDDETEAALSQAVQASGLSKSRWVADLIRSHAGAGWPAEWQQLAGAFADFPLREDIKADQVGHDAERIGF